MVVTGSVICDETVLVRLTVWLLVSVRILMIVLSDGVDWDGVVQETVQQLEESA